MKNCLVPFCALAIALLAAATGFAQSPKASRPPGGAFESGSTPAGRFQLTWSRVTSPDMAIALERLETAQRRQAMGIASEEEVSELRHQVERLKRHTHYLLTLKSDGGSLNELIAATSKSDDVSLTIINAGEPSDLEIQLPPFHLRNANWGTIIEVLANFLATRGLQLKYAGGDSPNPMEAKSVVCVLRRVGPATTVTRSDDPLFESFQLSDYLSEKQTVDDVVDAIRSAWKLDPKHQDQDLRLKFHPATRILLVSGPKEALDITRQVIVQLKRNPVVR